MSGHQPVGVVGLGRMGLTLAAGFSRAVRPEGVFAAGRSPASVARLRAAVPGATGLPLPDLPDRADVIVLCVAQQERGAPLPREPAERLVTQSLRAASRLVGQGSGLDDIVRRVAVPGGNTAAALDAARGGLTAAWHAAFEATVANERGKPAPELG